MVMMWDDHESANDSWQGGAENHDPAKEGSWSARKAAAQRAYREWLPVSDNDWEGYDIGDLATLFRPETRLTGRSRPPQFAEQLRRGEDVKASLIRFRDGAWRDAERTMLGTEQEAWLAGAFKRSTGQGTRWQILAQQTIMGSFASPPEARTWVRSDAPERVRAATGMRAAASEVGLPANLDAWDGYPAARDRLLRAALDSGSNLLVLSGDSHMAGPSTSISPAPPPARSSPAKASLRRDRAYTPGVAPAEVARACGPATGPQMDRRPAPGLLTLTLTRERALGEWLSLGHGADPLDSVALATHERDERHQPLRPESPLPLSAGEEGPKRRLGGEGLAGLRPDPHSHRFAAGPPLP
jgi:alkaline phosphatase D